MRANFKNERETFDGSFNVNSWEKNVKPYNLYDYKGTPFDNEDPIYHGFEVILDVQNSPLLNGEVDKFIDLGRNAAVYRKYAVLADELDNTLKEQLSQKQIIGPKKMVPTLKHKEHEVII